MPHNIPTFISLVLIYLISLSGCSTLHTAFGGGKIKEDYGTRTHGTKVEDSNIETKSKINLASGNESLKRARISVNSYNGIVLLTGMVSSEADRRQASNVVRKVRKVRRIHNELSLGKPGTFLSSASDALISGKINTRLSINDVIDTSRIKIVVEQGVVYLMGIVTPKEADAIVASVQKTSGIQRIVKVFEYIENSHSKPL